MCFPFAQSSGTSHAACLLQALSKLKPSSPSDQQQARPLLVALLRAADVPTRAQAVSALKDWTASLQQQVLPDGQQWMDAGLAGALVDFSGRQALTAPFTTHAAHAVAASSCIRLTRSAHGPGVAPPLLPCINVQEPSMVGMSQPVAPHAPPARSDAGGHCRRASRLSSSGAAAHGMSGNAGHQHAVRSSGQRGICEYPSPPLAVAVYVCYTQVQPYTSACMPPTCMVDVLRQLGGC